MELLLSLFLFSAIPDILFAPVAVGGYAMYEDVKSDIELEDALYEKCDIYYKDYTDCNPEWKWGNHKGHLNFQELLGFPLDVIQSQYITKDLIKHEDGQSIPTTNYILKLYFRENICVKVVYRRPMDKYFLACYGHGDELSFHAKSELLGDDYPIDITITHLNLLNVIGGKNPQTIITARFCGEKLPYVSSIRCNVLTMFNHPF